MAYMFKIGEKVIVCKGEVNELAGTVVGTGSVVRENGIQYVYLVDIGTGRRLEGSGAHVSVITVDPANLYPVDVPSIPW